jgi:signal transduction histidine kinase
MKRWPSWLPASLFGRLLLVLAGGLLVAQVLSAAINLAERDRVLFRAGGMQQVQRIVDAVQLLDSLGPNERARIVKLLSVPPLVLSLHDAPSSQAAAADTPRTGMFAVMLQSALGNRVVRVLPVEGSAAPWPPGHRHMMGGPSGPRPMGTGPSSDWVVPGGPIVRAEVQLRDGQWARFDSELPPGGPTLPWRLGATLAVLLGAVLVLSYVAVRWVTRPLHLLAGAAEALGRDINRPPLPEDGPIEIRQAAHAFNTMQSRLARFIDERTRLLAAMSHDLKTPITRMRLRAELLDDEELRQRFEADLKEMETMVGETLEFMRGLGGAESRQSVNVMALLASLQSDNESMGRRVRVEGEVRSPFFGIVSLLRRAISNLVDNAVLYGGSATVMVDDAANALTLRVLDDGPGIPAAELERVFEPFHRIEGSRSRATGGTGLGLTIVRDIAQLHGGEVMLRNRPGRGLEAILRLPRDAQHRGITGAGSDARA